MKSPPLTPHCTFFLYLLASPAARWVPLWLAWVVATGCASVSTEQTFPSSGSAAVRQSLDGWIASRAAASRSREFAVTRIQTEGDVDADQRPDTVLVYRLDDLDASGGFQQFLLVQPANQARPMLEAKVGSHGGRSITQVRVVAGRIELLSSVYLPTDSSCCPTGWRWIGFQIQGGELKELSASQESSR